jgi:purine-binding chemotaxis protein CheW
MDALPILTFQVGDQTYALRISDVLEVAAMVELLPMPQSTPEMLGLVNRHGEIIPLLDMRVIMGMERQAVNVDTFFIVVEHGSLHVGLVVDKIDQVKYFPDEQFQSIPGNPLVRWIVNDSGVIVQVLEVDPIIGRVLPQMER